MQRVRQFAASITIGFVALLSGCADRPMPVPSTASLMTEGNGERISFVPTQHGRVYVSDQSDNKILYQAEVNKGEMVEVRPREDRIVVGGRVSSDRKLSDGHQYRIFFEPLAAVQPAAYPVDQ
jgi:hypothetical protein